MDYLSPIVVYTHKNTVIASSLPVSSSFAIVSLVYVYENSSFHLNPRTVNIQVDNFATSSFFVS